MAWRNRFPTLDQTINRAGYWWAVFGPGGVLSVIMSAAAKYFTPIAELGWGAVIFAGVGAACVMISLQVL